MEDTSAMIHTMDDDLKQFIASVADSDVKTELLLYFHDNPAIDSPQGLAMWINRHADEIAREIDALVDAQILKRSGSGKDAIYMYAPSEAQRRRLDKFIDYYRSDRRHAEDEMEHLRQSLAELARSSLREIQREQSKTKTILASMVDGVVVTDANHRVVLYNPSAARILGIEGGIGLGRRFHDCCDDPGIRALAYSAEEVLRSNLSMIAQEAHVKSPKEMYLKAHLSTVRDENDDPVGVVTVLRDITEIKQHDEQRVAFVHMVSHELRSPLTSIKGFAQSLRRGIFGQIADGQKDPLDIIEQQSDRLLALINDMLEMARVDAGTREMKMEPVDLRVVIDKIARAFQPQIEQKGHALQVVIPANLIIDADADAMDHIFTNLLSNAVKYTPPAGTINVAGNDRGEHVTVSVSDTGIGIPEHALPKLFNRFFRVKDSRSREITGTGLGLAIVKNYVEAHMGTIEVESQIDKGTTFTVTLPKRHEVRQLSEVQAAIEKLAVPAAESQSEARAFSA